MIKARYVPGKYIACDSCQKQQPRMLQLYMKSTFGIGHIICLCDECKEELKKELAVVWKKELYKELKEATND